MPQRDPTRGVGWGADFTPPPEKSTPSVVERAQAFLQAHGRTGSLAKEFFTNPCRDARDFVASLTPNEKKDLEKAARAA